MATELQKDLVKQPKDLLFSSNSKKFSRNNVLLAIKPIHAYNILSGNKKWEYRRVNMHAENNARIFLYASAKIHAIIGEAVIEKIIHETVDQIIEHTVKEVPETAEDLKRAFIGNEIGCAIRLSNPIRYETPITLTLLRQKIPGFKPPQGFYYVKEGSSLLNILPVKKGYNLQK